MSTSSISSQVSSSSRSRDSRFSSAEPTELWERASRARSRTIRPADGGGRSTSITPAVAWGFPASAAARSAAVVSVGAAGVVGSEDGAGGADTRPRRGRTNSSQPPVPSASTAMTMIRITYSIRLTVSQIG